MGVIKFLFFQVIEITIKILINFQKMSDKIDNQLKNNSLRAIFNFRRCYIRYTYYGNMGQTCILWKRNVEFLGFKKPKDALQQHVKPKYKTTLVNEPGLYSLACIVDYLELRFFRIRFTR